MISSELIIDLGFHNGDDTGFYLAKGFRVVAVEANPGLVDYGQSRFKDEIKAGRLILLHKAVSGTFGQVTFHLHSSKTEWSSCLLSMAESDGTASTPVTVESTDLLELIKKYGVPHYLKVDVEGCDVFVAKQLSLCATKPKYVSFETSRKEYPGIFSFLHVAGYSRFQLVNQAINKYRQKPSRNAEGKDVSYPFSEFSSGYFGGDLPEEGWLTFDEAITRYVMYKELKRIDNVELGLGWVDVHARIDSEVGK